ncbi:carboxymuconolactone decarboxylase family protein [Salinisphaera sp. LB1]|uniref:carboxymuconolactone decarboxylase family protein n=1 Tax=Salinisphaera sp. LB1 TaxID=2183911 RepID=UPI000D708894|nr:carboxymuconolactone decarboxylase family protein [Salinisphaera sp. LB1]AWN15866.1 carboxymuconolactone decarboxylase [Salinisphaera sp. LB1]
MARIPYADIEADATKPLVERMTAQRGSVLHLYRMLLHSPPVAEGWLGFLTAIRQHADLDDRTRELVIMRIAVLNQASYEADQHRPIALAAGLTEAQLDQLAQPDPSSFFDARQSAVLALTDAMTREVRVAEATLSRVREYFDERGVVELVATIGAYNMVSRFLVALDVQSSDQPDDPC